MSNWTYTKVDGSMGEGGGQILRSALIVSAITKTPVEVSRIRFRRNTSGLRPQHLTAVKVMADLFCAQVDGLQVGSQTVRFRPHEFRSDGLTIDVGTAGSVPLILMTVIPAIALSGNRCTLQIVGGTDVPASPTTDYVRYVVLPAYRMLGIKFSLRIITRGYYPKGGGALQVQVEPCSEPSALELESAERPSPRIISVCSQLPAHVAQRQVSGALARIEKENIACTSYTASIEGASSPGSCTLVYCSSDSGIFIGGDSIGELGKKAETVGAEAAEKFLAAQQPYVQVDPHLADMLVVPMCFAKGKSRFRCSRSTSHLTTNLRVASLLTGCRYKLEGSSPVKVMINS